MNHKFLPYSHFYRLLLFLNFYGFYAQYDDFPQDLGFPYPQNAQYNALSRINYLGTIPIFIASYFSLSRSFWIESLNWGPVWLEIFWAWKRIKVTHSLILCLVGLSSFFHSLTGPILIPPSWNPPPSKGNKSCYLWFPIFKPFTSFLSPLFIFEICLKYLKATAKSSNLLRSSSNMLRRWCLRKKNQSSFVHR